MAARKVVEIVEPFPPLDFGASVRVLSEKAQERYGISAGSVCGFRIQHDPMSGREERMVLVEAIDGRSVEIPLSELELSPQGSQTSE